MPIEVEINGNKYRTVAKMPTMVQLHVLRRVLPIYSQIIADQAANLDKPNMSEMMSSMSAWASASHALALMSDNDVNFVVSSALATVSREQKTSGPQAMWAPVWNTSNGTPQFQDMELDVILRLTMQVVVDNIGNFLPLRQTDSPQPPPSQSDL